MALHAKLGASNAERWLNCAGSAALIDSLPAPERDRSSDYADEGSAAHALAEHALREGRAARDFVGRLVWKPEGLDEYAVLPLESSLRPDGSFEVDAEMAEAVQVYLDEIAYHRARLPFADELIEERVYPLPSRPGQFGTADFVAFDPLEGELVVVDYKHGAGVVVEVAHNAQAMFYALGALRRFGAADRVTLVIVQPRAPHEDGPVRRWTVDSGYLLEWGEHLEAAAYLAETPDAPLRAGPWCEKSFCAAAAICPALRERAYAVAESDFAAAPLGDLVPLDEPSRADVRLPDPEDSDELARAMLLVPLLDFWARQVEGMAQRYLETGGGGPLADQFKLVRKRSTRKWVDEEAVRRTLESKRGVRKADYIEESLRSPAQLEKVPAIGKKWVAKNCHKPEGGLTIVPVSDRRDAVAPSILTDFASSPLPEVGAEAPAPD